MNSLNLFLSSVAASGNEQATFVTLEPAYDVQEASQATLYDIYRMFLRAQAGIPAATYKKEGCPVEFDGDLVRIELSFFAWPSSQDLPFELSCSLEDMATISVPEVVEQGKERDVIFEMTDHYELDFFALAAALSWQSGCYTQEGVGITPPALVLTGSTIAMPQELFGVARLQALAWGHKYTLTITVDKGDSRLAGLLPVLTAAWKNSKGETETEQLELQLPPCVEFALALCAGDLGNTYCSHGKRSMTAYYSTCTAKVITVVPGPDPESYCSDIVP